MSYLHCPTCHCAYNVATRATCPRCEARIGAPSDPAEAIVAAMDELARTMNRATAEQLDRARSLLEARAVPALADGSGPIAIPKAPVIIAAPPLPPAKRLSGSIARRVRTWVRAALTRP